jgi:hypothetical protein
MVGSAPFKELVAVEDAPNAIAPPPATVLNQAFLEQIYHTPLKVVPQSDHPTPLFFIQH